MRVLMIEDNDSNAYLARFLLEQRGHSVEVAATGAAGVTMARKGGYDVILLDLRLPDGDGCDFAQQFGTPDVPVIAVSAHALATDHRRAIEVGCRSFIEKPIDVTSYVDRIEALVAAHE